MAEYDPSRALLFIGADPKWKADLRHVYTSLNFAAGLGHDVELEQLWLRTDHPVRIQTNSGDSMTDVLTPDACKTLAEIELHRYDTVEDDNLLSGRELHYIESFWNLGYSRDVMQEQLTATIGRVGGVAVLAGTELAINVAAGQYEDLRTLARATVIPD